MDSPTHFLISCKASVYKASFCIPFSILLHIIPVLLYHFYEPMSGPPTQVQHIVIGKLLCAGSFAQHGEGEIQFSSSRNSICWWDKSGALWETNERQLNPKLVRQRMFPKKGQYKLRPKRQEWGSLTKKLEGSEKICKKHLKWNKINQG